MRTTVEADFYCYLFKHTFLYMEGPTGLAGRLERLRLPLPGVASKFLLVAVLATSFDSENKGGILTFGTGSGGLYLKGGGLQQDWEGWRRC